MSMSTNPASTARPTMLTRRGESKNSGKRVTIEMRTTRAYPGASGKWVRYRHRVVRRLSSLALISLAALLGIAPAHAQVSDNCVIAFNGIEAQRIDSLNSPLELDTKDTLIFAGTDLTGTRSARLQLIIGPITVESSTSTYATPEQDFLATISLDDVSPYSIGLFRVEGETDSCSAAVWVRVSGRFPLATLIGLTALGLALGGITGQMGAVASRRRWARSAAALGGIATGAGLTLIGQQFGRLQVSYPSLAGVTIAVGGLGFISASLFNPTIRERRRERRVLRPEPRYEPAPAPEAVAAEPMPQSVASAAIHDESSQTPITESPAEPLPQPAPPSGPYWCYVMAPTDVFDLTDHTRTVAELKPGNWYLAKRTLGGWAHVVADEKIEGWVAEGAIHPH